jgi:CheY-like chemotaxis protein
MKAVSNSLIFIVDDDADDRQIILDAFQKHTPGMDYLFLESGSALLDNLRSEIGFYPTLILLDLNMPGILGLQTLQEIRVDKSLSHVPVIVLTTSALDADRMSAYGLGANCFIKKPDSYGKLVEITQSITRLWIPDIQTG